MGKLAHAVHYIKPVSSNIDAFLDFLSNMIHQQHAHECCKQLYYYCACVLIHICEFLKRVLIFFLCFLLSITATLKLDKMKTKILGQKILGQSKIVMQQACCIKEYGGDSLNVPL